MKKFLSKLVTISLLATLLPLNFVQMAFAMDFEAGADQTITLGDEVFIEVEATDLDGSATGVVSTFNWGDGSMDSGIGVESGDHFSLDATHTYASAGTYTLTITATEIGDGAVVLSEEEDTLTIIVEEVVTCSEDAYESNDDFSEAYELFADDTIEANLCEEDQDFFVLSLNAGDTIIVEATYTYVGELFGLKLFDEFGVEMTASDSILVGDIPADGEEVTETVSLVVENNEYYILAMTENMLEVDSYSLTVTVDTPDYDLYISDMYLYTYSCDGDICTGLDYIIGNQGSDDVDPTIENGVIRKGVTGVVEYETDHAFDYSPTYERAMEAGSSEDPGSKVSALDAGDYVYTYYMDYYDVVFETDETNNSMSFAFTVDEEGNVTETEEEEEELSDLTVTDVNLDTDGIITYTIENQGTSDVEEGTEVSADITILFDGAALYEETVVLTDKTDTAFMNMGGSNTYEYTMIAHVGEYTMTVYIDSLETVTESSEDNNTLEVVTEWVGYSSGGGGSSGGGSSSSDDDSSDDSSDDSDEETTDDSGEETSDETTDDEDVDLASEDEEGTGGDAGDSDEMADAADEAIECSDPFTDTESSFAQKAICLLYNAGTVSGKTETTFEPSLDVTRAEFLKMILLNAGEAVEAVELEVAYTDVTNAEAWYYEYVTYGTSIGVVEGYDDGSFGPNDEVSRSEAVVMLLRMAGVTSYEVTDVPTFDDVDYSETSWYAFAVDGSVDLGIVEGYEDNTFRPSNNITREEAAVIVRRAWYVWYTITVDEEVEEEATE